MRRLLTLSVLLLVMAGSSFSAEKDTAEVKEDCVKPHVVAPTENFQTAGQFARSPGEAAQWYFRYSPTDNTCYTMRSMLVARQPGSDVTETVGQRTCTPASHFQMKHSVQQTK